MLPITLNLRTLKILLIGQGDKLHAREEKLKMLGAEHLFVASYPLSDTSSFADYSIVMVVGLSEGESKEIYNSAKLAGCLVNVEDNKKYCDFFFQSFVKRGKLLISTSTNGASPATAKMISDKIEEIFTPEWEYYINEIAYERQEWKDLGKNYDEVNKLTKDYIKSKGWLS